MALKVEMRLDKLELQQQNQDMVNLLNEATTVMGARRGRFTAPFSQQSWRTSYPPTTGLYFPDQANDELSVALVDKNDETWCNGSTRDFESLGLGS